MNGLFEVIKPGLATSVQDLGRLGYQKYGVVVAGAMDPLALQISNILVGNARNEACLEIAMFGPKLRLLKETVIAICGANLSPSVDGVAVPLWKSFKVRPGQFLQFGQPKDGGYAYIAVQGGIKVPTVMGSKATYVKARLGGYHGRTLQKSDILYGEKNSVATPMIGRGLTYKSIPNYGLERKIKVILGPDQDAFTKESIQTFLTEKYEITNQSDRMGYRLTGPKLKTVSGADILSDAILPGTIQVPASGEPIVLLADRQTTGGYTRIATVISTDLPYIAQMLPGHHLTFESVTVEEAQHLYRKQEQFLWKLSAV